MALAALDRHLAVYLIGFDMGPTQFNKFNNVYADTEFYKKSTSLPTFVGNWSRQIVTVCKDFPACSFYRVMGDASAVIPEFNTVANLARMSMTDFVHRINNTKDF